MIPSDWMFKMQNGEPANVDGLARILSNAPEHVMDTKLIQILGRFIYED